jgi:hypothetical protein
MKNKKSNDLLVIGLSLLFLAAAAFVTVQFGFNRHAENEATNSLSIQLAENRAR